MLKSQEANAEPAAPATVAQARVTPDELSQALAAIEARKQAEASRLAGTIPIAQAVSELHLDSTPEEIWAEVQAQRAKDAAPEPSSFAAADAARREKLRQTQALSPQTLTPPRGRGARRWARIIGPALGLWTLFHFGIVPHIFNHPSTAVHTTQLVTLAQVPDGQEVYADGSALIQISEGKAPAQISVDKAQGDNNWTVFRRDGHVYLRGYTLKTGTLQEVRGKALAVYTNDNSGGLEGERTSNITLRVDKVPLQKSGGDADYSEIIVPNFQPDPLTTLTPWR